MYAPARVSTLKVCACKQKRTILPDVCLPKSSLHGFTLVNRQPESPADRLLEKHSQPAFTGKGDTLAQRAVSLPHSRVRGKLVWVWSGKVKFLRILYRVGMELSCKLGRPLRCKYLGTEKACHERTKVSKEVQPSGNI
eukprot:1151551-Pelagomonas_calceolata.AAC.8